MADKRAHSAGKMQTRQNQQRTSEYLVTVCDFVLLREMGDLSTSAVQGRLEPVAFGQADAGDGLTSQANAGEGWAARPLRRQSGRAGLTIISEASF